MNGAVAYDLFEDQYSDARSLPNRVRPKHFPEPENFSPGEDVELEEAKESPVLVLPVKEISNKDYKITLQKPIPVYLEGENRQYIAVHEESRICGEGPDIQAAFRDFEDSFISIYLSYTESKDPLSSGAKEYAQFLGQLVANIEKI